MNEMSKSTNQECDVVRAVRLLNEDPFDAIDYSNNMSVQDDHLRSNISSAEIQNST